MEEGTFGAWLKNEGDTVQPGDALCELITEKTTFPLEAEGEGILRRIVAGEKSVVPVGAVIGAFAFVQITELFRSSGSVSDWSVSPSLDAPSCAARFFFSSVSASPRA